MKHFLAFITALVSLTATAQQKNSSSTLLGLSFSPDHSFRTLVYHSGDAPTDLVIKSRNDNELAKFGYTAGLNVYFKCSRRVGFETGIQYANKGYQTKEQQLVYAPPDNTLPSTQKINYTYQYIGIPLKLKLHFGTGQLQFNTGLGFVTSILLNAKENITYGYLNGTSQKKSSSSTSGFKKLDFSPVISAGVNYQLNNKLQLFAEPSFRYNVLKTKDASISEHLWSAGLNVGFYCSVR
ncbi:outer membrane beta-barrel protein [Ferruginibacter sp.]